MKIKYEIIDNFLDAPTFTELQNYIIHSPAIPWQYNQRIEGLDADGEQKIMSDGKFGMFNVTSQNWRVSYMVHPFFADYQILSEHFSIIMPIINGVRRNRFIQKPSIFTRIKATPNHINI